jgi:hypothetical protein
VFFIGASVERGSLDPSRDRKWIDSRLLRAVRIRDAGAAD